MRILFRAAVLLGLAAGLACDEGTPEPGRVEGSLVSPFSSEGAAVLEVLGPIVDTVSVPGGDIYQHADGDVIRVVIVLRAPGMIRFRMAVHDVNAPPVVRIVEVADPNNELRADLDLYSVAYTVVN